MRDRDTRRRDRRTVERWLSALSAEVRVGIEVVSIDPYDAYRYAIHAALPHARIVCDHFTWVRGANAALDAVRRERQRQAEVRRPTGVLRSGQPPPGGPSSTAPATACSRPANA
ncbi:MAG: transposase [Solirubrobacteraceae bacterium]